MTDLLPLLDTTADQIVGDEDALTVMGGLCLGLNDIRIATPAEEWTTSVKASCLSHGLREMVHQDPYTLRAYEKPRGYAGDAVMLDYVYGGTPPEGTTEVGKRVFDGTTRLSNGLSVIERRDYIAALIDRTAREVDGPQILSVACGYLREAQVSEAIRLGGVGTLYALDQDAESLAVVEAEKPSAAIVTVNSSVKTLLRGKVGYSGLHLVYALGLYDYLTDPVARKLTTMLYGMLAPGGKLVVANYTPDSQGCGYMEAFMNWVLIYRDEAGLRACAADVPASEIVSQQTFRDRYGNIVFIEVIKA